MDEENTFIYSGPKSYREEKSCGFCSWQTAFFGVLIVLVVYVIYPPPTIKHFSHIEALLKSQQKQIESFGKSPKQTHSASLIESNGWIDTDDEEWEYMKKLHYQTRKNQMETDSILMNQYWNFNWKPSFQCPVPPVRIGKGDGGKVMCDPSSLQVDDCLVISIGSNGNFEFENHVLAINPNCEIHTFDHTWPKADCTGHCTPPDTIHYHKIGLGMKDEGLIQTLPTILKNNNLQGRDIHWFKIDCEGCEFEIYKNFYHPDVKMKQLSIEVHGVDTTKYDTMFEDMYKNGWVIFSKELNTFGCGERFSCVEFSWLRFNTATFTL